MLHDVIIDRLGSGGDGVAEGPSGPLFVPYTLAGERARVEIEPDGKHGRLVELIEPSPDRVEPVCPHFGRCGGCAVQHLEMSAYLEWKRRLVVAALRARGLDMQVEPVRPVPLASRRRASFGLARRGDQVVLGFKKERSHELVDIETCPVLSLRIVACLPKLKALLAPLVRAKREL